MKKKIILGILLIFYVSHFPCVDAKDVNLYVVPAITDNKILPNSSILSSYISDTISVKASPGEFESASFVVHANNDTRCLTIETSNLTGCNGEIQSSNVDIRVVKSWYQGGYTTNLGIYGRHLTPELLLKDDSLIKVEGEDWVKYSTSNPTGRNYLKVNGSYIDISDDSNKLTGNLIVPISERPIQDAATLQPVTLKKNMNKHFWVTISIPTGTLPGTYTGNITVRDSDVIINIITLNVMVLPINLLEPNIEYSIYYRGKISDIGSISSEYKTISQFTAEMQDLYSHGVKNPTVYTSNSSQLTQMYQIRQQIGMNNSNLYCLGLSLNSASSIYQVKSITSQYGVNEVFVYGPDEQSISDSTSREKIAAVHAAGGKVFNAQGQSNAEVVADALDLAVVSGSPNFTLAEAYHHNNHKIFSYANPQTVPEYPRTFRLNYGLLLWQKDYDGVMDYTYQGSFRDIWNDFDHTTYRDHVFAYPTSNGVIDTIQWEGFREGVDDMRYLATLQRAIMVNPSDTTAIEAQNCLNNLKNTSLSNLDLDNVRSQIIDYILLLESSSHKVSVNCGSGSGYYPKNHEITITAYTPQAGMIFEKWVGDTFYVSNISASTTNVTVPSHSISLKATYKPLSTAWYDSNYSYRKSIAVNHTQVSNSSLCNFSVLLSLTDPDLKGILNGGKIQYSNGRDIAFVLPDGTDMNYEVESYNSTTGKLIAWVRVPSLSAMTDTVFYMYFGNSYAYNNTYQNINSVWDSNYKGVYHLGETETGNAGDFKDSTNNSNHNKNVINQPNSTTGQIGNSQRFNGVNSCINIGNKKNLNLVNAFTISAWVNPTAFENNAYTGIVWKANNNDKAQNTAYGLTTYYYADKKLPELFATTSTGIGKYVCGITKLQTNQNQYIVATYNVTSNTTIIYFNGLPDRTSSTITGTVNVTSSDVYIGVRNKWFWNGTIDEVRISDIDRTPDWIRTEYNNQINPSLFVSEGSIEIRPSNIILPVANFSTNTTQGVAPLSVQFTDLSQNAVSRSWDFNSDGLQDSNKAYCVYVYTDPGNYTVNLTAINANGTNSKTAVVTVLEDEDEIDVLPVANFSTNTTSGNSPLSVSFIDISTGAPTSWNWNFGDGTSSTVKNPVHTYSTAGNYTVSLTVSNDAGSNTTIKTDYIKVTEPVQKPVICFWGSPRTGSAPLTVYFKDSSSGSHVAWNWSFGDGTFSTLQNPKHTYSTAGCYTVKLTVTNAAGSTTATKSNYVIVTGTSVQTPVADFSSNVTSGYPPLNVSFTDISKGAPTSWNWNFGDGTSSTVKNPVHTYSKAGNYTVSLTVSNAAGSNTTIEADYIKVTEPLQKPVANFNSNVTSGEAPLDVAFTDTSTGLPTAWSWDFGDGATSTDKNPEHTYVTAGNYTVNLTVSNANGIDSKLATITVGSRNIVVVSFNPLSTDLHPGSSQNVQIAMDRIPAGLSGFNFTISISDPEIVEITAVSFPSWIHLPINSTLPSSSVWMKGVDLTNQVAQGNTNVLLGNITLTGKMTGNTNINILPTALDDDNGDPINPDVVSGIVEVLLPALPVFLGCINPPTDLNNDGLYEDINGNGYLESDDVDTYYVNMDWIGQNGLTAYFDYNHNNRIDFNDVVKLRKMVKER